MGKHGQEGEQLKPVHLHIARLTLKFVNFVCEKDKKLAFIGRRNAGARRTVRPDRRCVRRLFDLGSEQLNDLLWFLLAGLLHTFVVIVESKTGRMLLAVVHTTAVDYDGSPLQ